MNSASDFTLLADEQFDFDISLSPTSSKEDNEECDDEVFIGPVKHKEKCVSAAIQFQELESQMPTEKHDQAVWSPLSGDKFVEIFKEAHLFALQLECSTNEDKKEDQTQTVACPVVEKFVQESKSKLKLLDILNEVPKTPVAIKRETYCIQDSPMHQLPPAIQHQISSAKKEVQKPQKSHTFTSPLKASKVMKSVPASPLALKTKAPQAKSAVPLPGTNKTVSRLQSSMKAPAVQTKANRLTVERPKLGKTSPPGRKNLSSMGSTEDLLSGNSSIASDISDSSFNNSSVMHSKKALPVPNKINMSKAQFKTPSAIGNLRRNTSSSSSSRSSINTSLNSSMSISPPASAKLNASVNTSLNTSVSSSKLKPNTGKLALVRPSGMGSLTKAATSDLLKNHLKPCTAVKANSNKSASVSVAQPQTPAGKMQRQTSAPNLRRLPPASGKPDSAMKTATGKPLARVMPTPTSRLKLQQKPEGLSPDRTIGKTLKPMRLLSCGDIGSGIAQSTPIVVGKGIPSTPSSKQTSALPTPVSRRMPGIVTPRTVSRTIPSLRPTPAPQALPKSSIKQAAESVECDPVNLKVTRIPQSPTEDCTTASEICCTLNFSPENKPVAAAQPETPKLQSPEVLLIDIEVDKAGTKQKKPFTLHYDSQPLIDLSNTPEVNKQPAPMKPASVAQLIDLSSPLIKLSPAANKENVEFDFPLVSF